MTGRRASAQPSQHAHADRGHDLYETPAEAVRALVANEWLPNRIWDPCCGPGAIMRELLAAGHDVTGSDIVDYGHPNQAFTADFLAVRQAPFGTEAVVMNFPFKLGDAFVEHAIALCPRVVVLARLGFLESERRRPILDGGQLARIYAFRDRLPMMHRHGWSGPKNSSSTAFCWLVFDRSWKGPAQFHRISWKETAAVREAAE